MYSGAQHPREGKIMPSHETEDILHLLQPSSQEYTQILQGLEVSSCSMLFLQFTVC